MMKKYQLYSVVIFVGSFLFINAIYKPELKIKQAEKIIIGSGGGFTGQTKEYILSKDGSVLLKQGNKQADPFSKISKKEFHHIITKSEEAGFSSLNVDESGNFYHFIEITRKDKTKRVTWSNQSNEEGKKLQGLYNYIMEIILKSKNNQKDEK